MYLYFLGTGAGKPSLTRNVAGIAVKMPQPRKDVWLFDCGEGTQHQVLRSPFNLRKISRIFITHLHGDHIFGLPGLLATRSFGAGEKPLTVYGPAGIKKFLSTAIRLSMTRLSYPLTVEEISLGELEVQDWRIKVGLLEHGVPSYGYRLEEPARRGRLKAEKLKELEIPPGPIYGRLKRGDTVVLEDGRVLVGKDFVGPLRKGRHVVILGDTRYSQAAVELARNADLLVHEATFAKALTERAYKYYHSTTAQAARIAKEAGVRELVLTHFSSRYKESVYAELLLEAQSVFPNTHLAKDHFKLEIPGKK